MAQTLQGRADLTAPERGDLASAAAVGARNYLKTLVGLIAATGTRDSTRTLLRGLLRNAYVHSALRRVPRSTWQDQIFTLAARWHFHSALVLMGKLWARTGRLGVLVDDHGERAEDD